MMNQDRGYGDSYNSRKSIIPAIVILLLIGGIFYFGVRNSQDDYAIANVRVYRPLYGSLGLRFTYTKAEVGSAIPIIEGIKNAITFNNYLSLTKEYVHVVMYVDGVECNSIHGKAGLGNEIIGKIVCPISPGSHTITVSLVDHTGTEKDTKTFQI